MTRPLVLDLIRRYVGRPEHEVEAALRDPALFAVIRPNEDLFLRSDEERLLAALITCPCQFAVPLVARLAPDDFASETCAEIFTAAKEAYAEDVDFEIVDVGVRLTTEAARKLVPRLDVGVTTDFAADGAARYAASVLRASIERSGTR